MDFNKPINLFGTKSNKWDQMESTFGVPAKGGLPMWVADSDYQTAPCVIDAVHSAANHGVFNYSWEYPEYKAAIVWWMETRHGWDIDLDWILTTQGLGNGIANCIQTWSEPGDHVVIFTPVYHEFAIKIVNNNRRVTECPLVHDGDTYLLDLDDAQSRLTGKEKMLIWCSPQNPSGRIWTADELRAVSEFAARNNLILVCDEIHHDLVYPGHRFVPMDVAVPDGRARHVFVTAPSKTFNTAGMRTGQMIIPDDDLRAQMKKQLRALDYKPASLGLTMTEAAYSPEGATWVDALIVHLNENRRLLDAGVNAIPGVHSMNLQSTFLAWIDFEGTGMGFDEISRRLREDAKIAASPGPSFGQPGAHFMRFNFATQKANVEDAVERLQTAFADLQ